MTLPKKYSYKAVKLTEKQEAFIKLYNGENLVEAVKKAGYNCKSDTVAQIVGNELLRNEKVMSVMKGTDMLERRKDVADKGERMVFLTGVMRDDTQPVLARLRACELLGKTCGDYIERHEVDVNQPVLVLNRPMQLEALQLAKKLTQHLAGPREQGGPKEIEPVIDVEVLDNAVCEGN